MIDKKLEIKIQRTSTMATSKYILDSYKPGGIRKKINHYRWMLNDRSTNLAQARTELELNPSSPKLQRQVDELKENFDGWRYQYYEFTEKPNNDPEVVKIILDSLIELSKHEVPTHLYMYLDELKDITITNEDINYLIDIFTAQKETFESTYFNDVAENIDEAKSRAEAETEMDDSNIRKIINLPNNNFELRNSRAFKNNYKKIVKLAHYYDQTKQYKKADKITYILSEFMEN